MKDGNDYVLSDYLIGGGISITIPLWNFIWTHIFFNHMYTGLIKNVCYQTNGIVEKIQKIYNHDGRNSIGASVVIPIGTFRVELGYAYPLSNVNNEPFKGFLLD